MSHIARRPPSPSSPEGHGPGKTANGTAFWGRFWLEDFEVVSGFLFFFLCVVF